MNILVTGCAGFIGSRASSQLLDEGHVVVGVDNLAHSANIRLMEWRLSTLNQRPGFAFHRLDISDTDSLRTLFQGNGAEGPTVGGHQSRRPGRCAEQRRKSQGLL